MEGAGLGSTLIGATIDFGPDTLNLNSGGKWVTAYIELPEDYDVKKIDGSTVLLTMPGSDKEIPAYLGKQGWAKAEANESNIVDHDDDGILERMVKFDRNTVIQEILKPGDEVMVMVTGRVEHTKENGDIALVDFEGMDTIRVIDKGKPEVAEDKGKGKPKAAPERFVFSALPPYPQPCNPDVWIPYTLAEDVEVTITIYSSFGRIIRTLYLGRQNAGAYTDKNRAAYWDGRNRNGERVSSGIYFYHIKAGDYSAIRRMLILK